MISLGALPAARWVGRLLRDDGDEAIVEVPGHHAIHAIHASLAGHGGRVLYIGSFSKSLHPGLRLGFLVLPAGLLPAFAGAKALSDRHSPGDAQAVLARFITKGHLLRHLRRMRALYLRRQARLSHYTVQARRRGWLFGYAGYSGAELLSAIQALAPLLQDRALLPAPRVR